MAIQFIESLRMIERMLVKWPPRSARMRKFIFFVYYCVVSDNMKPLKISLPDALGRFAHKSVVLSGEALLDPIFIAYVGVLLNAVDSKAMVNKVDFMHLQGINGGNLPDEGGVASIDADIDYQNPMVEENNKELRLQIGKNTPLKSTAGSLALLYEMQDRGLIELYGFINQYSEGIDFLTTGDPDGNLNGSTDPKMFFKNVYGEGSIVDDVLITSQREGPDPYWSKNFESLYPETYLLDDFRCTQIYTRVGCIGRCAKTHEPFLTNNPLVTQWLNNTGLGRHVGAPVEQQAPILIGSLEKSSDRISVGDVIDFIYNPTSKVLVRETLEQERLNREKNINEAREDWLLLVLNLILGIVPGVGQMATLLSHLYQRRRAGKWY